MIGTTIDQYKITRALGKSAEAEDFLALQLQSGQEFHIRAVSQSVMSQPGFKQQLMADAGRMLELEHPNLVPLTNVLEHNGRLFMVREFVEGDSLATKLSRLSVGSALTDYQSIFMAIARGVAYAHSQELTHRFLNPDNIIITPDQKVRIIGFDQVLPRLREQRLGRPGLLMEARYFSPERFKTPDTTDTRANLYALGIILFQMTTGKVPFRDKDYKNLYKRHAALPVPDPCSINPNLPPEIAGVIVRALSKKPEERQQTVMELVEESARVLEPKAGPGPSGFEILDDADPMDGGFDFSAGGGDTGMMSAVGDEDEDPFGFAFENSDPEENDIFAQMKKPEEAQAPASSFDFGSEPATDDMDFGFKTDGPDAEEDFGFAEDESTAPGQYPGLGTRDQPGRDDFSFGLDEPEAGSDDFGFGMDEPKAGADDFGFAMDEPKAGADDFGFAMDDPKAGADDFGFGMDEPKIETNGPSSKSPAGPAEDDFGFGDEDGGTGFDFGDDGDDLASAFGDEASAAVSQADPGDDFGLDAPASGLNDSFTFHPETPVTDDFGMGEQNQGGFSFNEPAPASSDFSFIDDTVGGSEMDGDDDDFGLSAAPAKASKSAPVQNFGLDDHDFGGGSGGGFDFGNEPESGGIGFDFGSEAESDFNLNSAKTSAPAGFDFGQEEEAGGGGFDFQDLDGSLNQPASNFDLDGPDTGGFDLSSDAQEENPFTFGGQDPFDGNAPEEEDFFGNSSSSAIDDDPFADLKEETLGAAPSTTFDEPPVAFKPAARKPAAPDPAPVAPPVGETEDGAFSWDFEDLKDTDPTPNNPNMAGLAASFQKLDKGDEPEYADESVKVKRVRKVDKKILGITVILALVVVAAVSFWLIKQQQNRREEQARQEVNQLLESRNYDGTLARISSLLAEKPSGSQQAWLKSEESRVNKIKADAIEQVQNLLQRASEFQTEGQPLVDGKNDAYGTYHSVLGLDPSNKDAQEGVRAIREQSMARAAELIGGQGDLEALKILQALATGDKKDKEAQRQYTELKNRLKEEQAGTLQEQISSLFSKQDYSPAVPLLKELEQIDPNSKFVKDTREDLIRAFIEQGQELVAQMKFGPAESSFRNALELDPQNKEANDSLNRIGEERLQAAITRSQTNLERAIERKDIKSQYEYAVELQGLDPGNVTANIALASVNKELDKMRQEAIRLTEVGQFKDVANLYKGIYEIDGDEQTRALWQRYDRWAPPPGMAYIPQGPYNMGNHRTATSRPQHIVNLSAFFIDKYEVTNRDFKAFVDANPGWSPSKIDGKYHNGDYLAHWEKGSPKISDLDLPVVNVSWFAAEAYARWKNKRLPSEAEWEKAAAGNTSDQNFWWGNYSDAKSAIYEFYPAKQPGPVGSFPSNNYGIHEILGNVNEWVADTYSTEFYAQTVQAKDPVNKFEGPTKVFRGGSFKSRGEELYLYLRFHQAPTLCHPTLGFRCASNADLSL